MCSNVSGEPGPFEQGESRPRILRYLDNLPSITSQMNVIV